MEFIILWLVFGLIGFLLGKWKGREGLGFWLGFLLGPIGWVIMLVVADVRLKCPYCAGALPEANVTRCKHCSASLVKPRSIGTVPVPATDPIEEWEMQERANQGALPVPEHLRGQKIEE